MSDIYISPATAIKLYDVSRPTLVRWGKLGKIRYLRCGTGDKAAHRYHKHDLDRYFGNRSQSGLGENEETRKIYLYARVSSSKQKEAGDLTRQIETLKEYCTSYDRVVADVASGLNFKRRGLITILEQVEAGNVSKIVVTYRDRLARFGIELLERTWGHSELLRDRTRSFFGDLFAFHVNLSAIERREEPERSERDHRMHLRNAGAHTS